MKKRWFAVPFAIGIVAMMLVVMLPGPLSPSQNAIAVSWNPSTMDDVYITGIHFLKSDGMYCKDASGAIAKVERHAPKDLVIDSSFEPATIRVELNIDGQTHRSNTKLTIEIRDPQNILVYSGETIGEFPFETGAITHHDFDISSQNIDWTTPGYYKVTMKLYYWM